MRPGVIYHDLLIISVGVTGLCCTKSLLLVREDSNSVKVLIVASEHSPGSQFQGHSPRGTVPGVLSQGHCPRGTVSGVLSQGHCPRGTVPGVLSQGHCPRGTVPEVLSQGYCPRGTVPPK